MLISIAQAVHLFAATLSEGDVVRKFRPEPKFKPPRRKPSTENKSDRSDYMKNYMSEYRQDGKDYQKKPDNLKEFNKKYRKNRKEKKVLAKSLVFLGGTCAESTWRDEIEDKLQINSFNPVVKNWTKEMQEIEEAEKKKSDIHLYVITSDMKGVFSIAEAVESSHDKTKKTLLHVIPKGFDKPQLKSLQAVVDLVKSHGGTAYVGNDLNKTVKILNSWEKD